MLGAVLVDVAVLKLTELLFDRVCRLGIDDLDDMVCRLGILRTVPVLGSEGRVGAGVSIIGRALGWFTPFTGGPNGRSILS